MITEKKEKQILMMSFFSGLLFAIAEFIFSIYSHSQSALTDAVYDASELVFIALPLWVFPAGIHICHNQGRYDAVRDHGRVCGGSGFRFIRR